MLLLSLLLALTHTLCSLLPCPYLCCLLSSIAVFLQLDVASWTSMIIRLKNSCVDCVSTLKQMTHAEFQELYMVLQMDVRMGCAVGCWMHQLGSTRAPPAHHMTLKRMVGATQNTNTSTPCPIAGHGRHPGHRDGCDQQVRQEEHHRPHRRHGRLALAWPPTPSAAPT